MVSHDTILEDHKRDMRIQDMVCGSKEDTGRIL
jgi:hypothetical protein